MSDLLHREAKKETLLSIDEYHHIIKAQWLRFLRTILKRPDLREDATEQTVKVVLWSFTITPVSGMKPWPLVFYYEIKILAQKLMFNHTGRHLLPFFHLTFSILTFSLFCMQGVWASLEPQTNQQT